MTAPNEPAPFWTWGWRGAPWWKRAWLAYRMSKPVIALAAVVTAILFIVDVLPRVYAPLAWRDREYALLREIHAGYELDYVSDRLGPPALLDRTAEQGEARWRELIYVRRDHYVQVIVDDDDRVLLYAVTSCDPGFQPTFDASEGVEVRLQDRALRESAEWVGDVREGTDGPTADDVQSWRTLYYRQGLTGSSPEYFVESWGGSNADRLRNYYVGVNTACLQAEAYDRIRRPDFAGPADSAPAGAAALRAALSANTYAESAPGVSSGRIITESGDIEGLGSGVGPDSFRLPPNFEWRGETRLH